MGWLVAPLALLIERLVGYPPALFSRIGHPVTWMGALITWLERELNKGEARRWKGVVLLAFLLATGLVASLLIIVVAEVKKLLKIRTTEIPALARIEPEAAPAAA